MEYARGHQINWDCCVWHFQKRLNGNWAEIMLGAVVIENLTHVFQKRKRFPPAQMVVYLAIQCYSVTLEIFLMSSTQLSKKSKWQKYLWSPDLLEPEMMTKLCSNPSCILLCCWFFQFVLWVVIYNSTYR